MTTSGIFSETKNGCLYVWFDSPASEINILDRPTADALVDVLSKVNPTDHRAVVFLTKKTGSFINGVGLMLASAIKSVDEAFDLTAPVRAAYSAVLACPVPTVAVIKGSCYGCGVEFASHCTYRVAVECVETQFYMTEIPEYLFIPAFGGSQLLPPLVGVEKATDLVLWGEKWGAEQARRFGLVQDTLPLKNWQRELERRIPGLLSQYVHKVRPTTAPNSFIELTDSKIAGLSTELQPLYREAFHLLKSGASSQGYNELSARREVKKSAESVMEPRSRQAQGFFFIRQSARLLAEKGREENNPVVLNLLLPKSAEAWGKTFLSEPAESFLYAVHTQAKPGAKTFLLETRNSEAYPFTVGRNSPRAPHGVYWPGYAINSRLVEIRNVTSDGARGDLAFAFHRMGFSTITTHGENDFFLDRFWSATVSAMRSLFEAGVNLPEIESAIGQFGFSCPVTDWAARFGAAWKTEFPKRTWKRPVPLNPRANESIPRLFIAEWMAVVLDCIDKTELAHPAFADVVARELMGFPLMHQSLSRLATRKWLREVLLADTKAVAWMRPELLAAIRRYVDFSKSHLSQASE